MRDWLTKFLKGKNVARDRREDQDADLDELAKLFMNGNPEDPATIQRLADMLGQSDREKR